MTAENKPNIVRVERDENVKAGQFYKVFYDRATGDEYVINKDGTFYVIAFSKSTELDKLNRLH